MMYFHFKNKLFLFSILSFVVFLFILNYQTYASSCTVLKDKHFSFYERKKKAMRRFKYDLDEKRDRSSKMLDKLLSNAIDFF
ncbi:hypothetical protein PFNF54_00890 [Plasmodium falciparum NF54]|uniref:Uncharacterized protein n=1 Tax=Plasmodium falciparum (isolate NF54) TaxID=5843 RepID=W7JYY4_PLAFO|nr:hypothetical protein PFNF54_00890 [Plasmodium falciparum NF54]